MPQKKNADSLELIRGKAGRIFGRVSDGEKSRKKQFHWVLAIMEAIFLSVPHRNKQA